MIELRKREILNESNVGFTNEDGNLEIVVEHFVIATGQDDNIGDAVLRRRMLTPLQRSGRCHVYVGANSDSYVQALAIGGEHRVYTNFPKWLITCTLYSMAEKTTIVHNAGEIGLNKFELRRDLSLVPATLISRLRGNSVVRLGQGIRDPNAKLLPVFRALLQLDSDTMWRDSLSRATFSAGGLIPDWAFDEFSNPPKADLESRRGTLALSMRFDRDLPTDSWFHAVRTFAETHELSLHVVAQVRRDNEVSEHLADRLGADLTPWEECRSHLEQEQKIRRIYRTSRLVISDRLHVLIIGLTEGAIPVGTVTYQDVKIGRHFDVAGIQGISFDCRDLSAQQILEKMSSINKQGDRIRKLAVNAAGEIKRIEHAVFEGRCSKQYLWK